MINMRIAFPNIHCKMSKLAFLQIIAVIFISLVANSPGGKAITCSEVDTELAPCFSYVKGGGSVPQMCCDAMKNLVDLAKTKADRQAGCECLKTLMAKASNEELARAAAIPGVCGVPLPFKIGKDTDCSKVPNSLGLLTLENAEVVAL